MLNGQNETPHGTPQQSPRVYALSIVGELLRKVGVSFSKEIVNRVYFVYFKCKSITNENFVF